MSGPHPARPCPSWARLVRFVADGGPFPAEHLQACPRCRERRAFLEQLPGAIGTTHEAPRDTCPDPTILVEIVDGPGPADRGPLADHLADCDACATLLRELLELTDAVSADSEVRETASERAPLPSLETVTRRGASPLVRTAAAALLLALAAAAVFSVPFPAVDSGNEGRWRGPAPRLEASVEWRVDAPPAVLQWQAWTAATAYRIRAWNEAGDRVLERHVAADGPRSLELTPTSAQAGDVFLWQVEALESGEVVATSGIRELTWRSR